MPSMPPRRATLSAGENRYAKRASKLKYGLGGKTSSANSKTGRSECSQAMSDWKTLGMTPAIAAILGKCRSISRQLGHAQGARIAGNEAKAQHWEHRAAKGQTLTERAAQAKALRAQRRMKQAQLPMGTPKASPEPSQPAAETPKAAAPKGGKPGIDLLQKMWADVHARKIAARPAGAGAVASRAPVVKRESPPKPTEKFNITGREHEMISAAKEKNREMVRAERATYRALPAPGKAESDLKPKSKGPLRGKFRGPVYRPVVKSAGPNVKAAGPIPAARLRDAEHVTFMGNTFENKEAIAATGATWNANMKVWQLPGSKINPQTLEGEIKHLHGKGVRVLTEIAMLKREQRWKRGRGVAGAKAIARPTTSGNESGAVKASAAPASPAKASGPSLMEQVAARRQSKGSRTDRVESLFKRAIEQKREGAHQYRIDRLGEEYIRLKKRQMRSNESIAARNKGDRQERIALAAKHAEEHHNNVPQKQFAGNKPTSQYQKGRHYEYMRIKSRVDRLQSQFERKKRALLWAKGSQGRSQTEASRPAVSALSAAVDRQVGNMAKIESAVAKVGGNVEPKTMERIARLNAGIKSQREAIGSFSLSSGSTGTSRQGSLFSKPPAEKPSLTAPRTPNPLLAAHQEKAAAEPFKLSTASNPKSFGNSGKGRTPFMFDMKKGDLPGQTTIMEQHGTVDTRPTSAAEQSRLNQIRRTRSIERSELSSLRDRTAGDIKANRRLAATNPQEALVAAQNKVREYSAAAASNRAVGATSIGNSHAAQFWGRMSSRAQTLATRIKAKNPSVVETKPPKNSAVIRASRVLEKLGTKAPLSRISPEELTKRLDRIHKNLTPAEAKDVAWRQRVGNATSKEDAAKRIHARFRDLKQTVDRIKF